jgi:hypothetical protein
MIYIYILNFTYSLRCLAYPRLQTTALNRYSCKMGLNVCCSCWYELIRNCALYCAFLGVYQASWTSHISVIQSIIFKSQMTYCHLYKPAYCLLNIKHL